MSGDDEELGVVLNVGGVGDGWEEGVVDVVGVLLCWYFNVVMCCRMVDVDWLCCFGEVIKLYWEVCVWGLICDGVVGVMLRWFVCS